jgi:hypothetical protein
MTTDVITAFGDSVQAASLTEGPITNDPPEYKIGLPVSDCVPAFTDEDGIDHEETAFSYGVVIEFSSYEDMSAFLGHPEREEMQNSITEYIKNQNRETLELEKQRDLNPVYPDAGPETFNDGTLGDFQVSIDEIIPQINAQYGTNIASGYVLEDSTAITDGCIPSYIGPNEFADAGDLGMGGMNMGTRTN